MMSSGEMRIGRFRISDYVLTHTRVMGLSSRDVLQEACKVPGMEKRNGARVGEL